MRALLAVLTVLAGCGPSVATGAATQQLVTVETSSLRTTYATVALWRRREGCWTKIAGPWAGRVGRSGVSASHREGDGTTPAGVFRIGPVVYGTDPDPGVRFRYHRLVCGDWWDEDPSSPTYNTFRHVRCGARPPFGGGSEALWTMRAYRQFAVVEYNAGPTVPGRGSAIFVHHDTGRPTNGCVSLPSAELLQLLRALRPRDEPVIAIGTRAQLRR
jgi:L,D-peptidoglycan transpeptidase YkuD (ErfK/YbiS/YcfS/YnhG family)